MGAFGLTEFRRWTKNFSRGHHFLLGIGDLPLYNNSMSRTMASAEFSPHLSVFASATSLPTSEFNIGFALLQKGNVSWRYPMDKIYPPWTVTFYCDSNHLLRNTFLQWQERIFDTTQKTHTPAANWKSNQLWVGQIASDTDCPVSSCVFRGAWPSVVSAVRLDQAEAGISTFEVTFSYDYYEYAHTDGDDMLQAMKSKLEASRGNSGGSSIRDPASAVRNLIRSEVDFLKNKVGAVKCQIDKIANAPASSGLLPDIKMPSLGLF